VTAETVYYGRGIVLLIFGRKPHAFVENEPLLSDGRAFALLGLRDRRDELCGAPSLDDPLRRLTLVIELPVTRRIFIRGVKDGTLEEWILSRAHFLPSWLLSQT
jgi:hypothetical protein